MIQQTKKNPNKHGMITSFFLWILEYLINFWWNTRYPIPTPVAVGFEIWQKSEKNHHSFVIPNIDNNNK
jgi:hypothetical protein